MRHHADESSCTRETGMQVVVVSPHTGALKVIWLGAHLHR